MTDENDQAGEESQQAVNPGGTGATADGPGSEPGVADATASPQDPQAGTTEDSGADAADLDADADPEAVVETTYDVTPAGGHRVTRRTVRRTTSTERVKEDVAETITEDLPAEAYQAPRVAHPAPVG